MIDETHLGKIISNKTQGDGHKQKRPNAKALKVLPKSEWVVVENCHELTKTQEEHDRIIELIGNRKLIGTKARHQTYAFSGLIKCAKCGHSHTYYIKRNEVFMKPCWYINPMGEKCQNEGIKVSVIEDMVLEEIKKYKDDFIANVTEAEVDTLNSINEMIAECEANLQRQKRALEVVNDAYEFGDYSRSEWLRRKKKWEDEIFHTSNALYELKKKAKSTAKITNADRQKMLDAFFENITQMTGHAARNDLYRMIIESIVWHKKGDDIKVIVNFK